MAYDEVTTPVPSPAPRPTHPDARATQQLTRPGPALGPGGLPLWAIAAMAALAFLAFASLAVAVVALLL